jgi:hypothetical protein
MYFCGTGSSVGITTDYRLDGPGIEFRWRARFSAPVQTGPGSDLASCKMGTGSFLGVKSGRGLTLTPHPLLVPLVMKEYSYTSTPPMGRTACTEPQCLYKSALYLYLIYFFVIFMYSYCYVYVLLLYTLLYILFHCVVLCIVCV